MGPLGVVERYPILDHAPGLEAIIDLFEIDRFLLQAPPQSLNEDVVEVSASTIHRVAHARFGQGGSPSRSAELAALTRVHGLGLAVFGDGLVQRFDAEIGMHRIRQPLGRGSRS